MQLTASTTMHRLLLLLLLLATGCCGVVMPIQETYTLMEKLPAGTVVGDVRQLLLRQFGSSEAANASVSPYFPDKPTSALFRVDNAGRLVTSERLDRDRLCAARRLCCDKSMRYLGSGASRRPVCELHYFTRVRLRTADVHMLHHTVQLVDDNDHSPAFPRDKYVVHFPETDGVGEAKELPLANDADWGDNGVVSYSLRQAGDLFELRLQRSGHRISGVQLLNTAPVDRERTAWYGVTLVARDGGGKSAEAVVNVTVEDANDCSPEFVNGSKVTVEVSESSRPHSAIFAVKAVDRDAGQNARIHYVLRLGGADAFPSGLFSVDSRSGTVSLNDRLLYRPGEENSYRLRIRAYDHGTPKRSGDIAVQVNVLDTNNHEPDIRVERMEPGQAALRVQENENYGPDRPIATVVASDRDGDAHGPLSCSLAAGERRFGLAYFRELPHSRERLYHLHARGRFDREETAQYHLRVRCVDAGDRSSEKALTVLVADANDSPPEFRRRRYDFAVAENLRPGAFVGAVGATDRDVSPNDVVQYRIEPPTFGDVSVNPSSGQLTTAKAFDREQQQTVEFSVVAFNTAPPRQSATAVVRLRVLDENDNAPAVAAGTPSSVVVSEDARPPAVVASVNATDADEGDNAALQFSLAESDGSVADRFAIDSRGRVTLVRPLDRERQQQYHLVISIQDRGRPRRSSSFQLTVEVGDVNDTPPRFMFPSIDSANNQVNISNTRRPGSVVAQISATDEDAGPNGNLTYHLIHAGGAAAAEVEDSDFFELEPLTGVLRLRRSLSGVQRRVFLLRLQVRDQGVDRQLRRSAVLRVHVQQVAERRPDRDDAAGRRNRRLADAPSDISGVIVLLVAGLAILILLILILSIVFLITKRRCEGHRLRPPDAVGSGKEATVSYDTVPQARAAAHLQHQGYAPQSMPLSVGKNRRNRMLEKLDVDAAEQMLDSRPDVVQLPDRRGTDPSPLATKTSSSGSLAALQLRSKSSTLKQQQPLYQNPCPGDAYSIPLPNTARPYVAKSIAYTQLNSLTQLQQASPSHKARLPYDHVSDV